MLSPALWLPLGGLVLFLTLPRSSPCSPSLGRPSPSLNNLIARKSPSWDLFKILLVVCSSLSTSCPWAGDQLLANLYVVARRALDLWWHGLQLCPLLPVVTASELAPQSLRNRSLLLPAKLASGIQLRSHKRSLSHTMTEKWTNNVFHLPGGRHLHRRDSSRFFKKARWILR